MALGRLEKCEPVLTKKSMVKGKTYTYKVRAYIKIGDKTYWGKYSKIGKYKAK